MLSRINSLFATFTREMHQSVLAVSVLLCAPITYHQKIQQNNTRPTGGISSMHLKIDITDKKKKWLIKES